MESVAPVLLLTKHSSAQCSSCRVLFSWVNSPPIRWNPLKSERIGLNSLYSQCRELRVVCWFPRRFIWLLHVLLTFSTDIISTSSFISRHSWTSLDWFILMLDNRQPSEKGGLGSQVLRCCVQEQQSSLLQNNSIQLENEMISSSCGSMRFSFFNEILLSRCS